MHKTLKKILIVALCLCLAGGGTYAGVRALKKNSAPIPVYSLNDIGMVGYWGDNVTYYGNVSADNIQSVYISPTQIIKEVYVGEGQTVRIGDPLVAYDSTLTELEVTSKDIEVQKIQYSIEQAQKELKTIQGYKPGVPIYGTVVTDAGTGILVLSADAQHLYGLPEASGESLIDAGNEPSSEAGEGGGTETEADPSAESEQESEPTAPEETEPTTPEETEPTTPEETEPTTPEETEPTTPEETEPAEPPFVPEYVMGQGTEVKPDVWTWKEGEALTMDRIRLLLKGRDSACVVLMIRDPESSEHMNSYIYRLNTRNDKGEEELSIVPAGYLMGPDQDPLILFGDEQPTEPVEPVFPTVDPWYDPGVTFTASELARMRADKELEIRNLELDLKVAQVEYEKLKLEFDNQTITADVNGTVVSVLSADEAAAAGTPMIMVSGGGGYYVETGLSEFDLEKISVGTKVMLNAYESGNMVEAEFSEISQFPLTSGSNWYYNGMGNYNASYYPAKVFASEDAGLREGEYVEIVPQLQETGEQDSLYLMKAFIRSENGRSYVYVRNAEGMLEQRFISTGKSLWGEYTQIRSGLTPEDWVAFPHGKDVKDGAPTKEGSMNDLYNW